MRIPRLFKTPSHQKFDYKPMYYDALKEEMDSKERAYSRGSDSPDLVKDRISKGFRSRSGASDPGYLRQQLRKVVYIRLAVMAVLIFFVFLFIQQYLPKMVEWLAS